MKKRCLAAFAVMVLMVGFAVCQEKESSKGLIIEGAKVTGYTFEVPENLFIPKGVAEIDEDAFEDCLTLVSVNIPDTVVIIGEYAFCSCENLKSVTIGKGVKSIGEGAFYGCESLVSVTIPKNVTSIGEDLFEDCTSLKEIQFGGTMAQWKNLNRSGEVNIPGIQCSDGYIGVKNVPVYLKMYGTVVTGCNDKVPANLVIPDGVTEIGVRAFEDCASLASVVIPEGVKEIGHYAFRGCKSLASVDISKNVMKIGGGAFGGCKNIAVLTYKGSFKDWCAVDWDSDLLLYAKRIMLSDGTDPREVTEITASDLAGVTKIGESAFYGCKSLASVEIPKSVTSIGRSAFANRTKLTSVEIPNSVTSIGEYSFAGCTSLASVSIPRSVTEIGYNAFVNRNPNLKIHYDGTKAQWNAISKGRGDNYPKIGNFTVQCTDGEVVVR